MENILKLNENGTTLGLRELAKQLGVQVREAINNNTNIIIDFEKVESVSSSFADELVAKIMFEVGQDKFINCVKIRNTNDFIKTMINTCVKERFQMQK